MGAARGRLCPLQRVAQQWIASLKGVESQRERRRRSSQARKAHHPNWHGQLPGQSKYRAAAVWPRSRPAAAAASDPERETHGRQRRLAATEPGNIDRGIIPRGLAHQQIAPDFDGCLGLLDILEEGDFAVKAAPAAGLEQLSQVLQPLLGKSAPARDNIAATFHVN